MVRRHAWIFNKNQPFWLVDGGPNTLFIKRSMEILLRRTFYPFHFFLEDETLVVYSLVGFIFHFNRGAPYCCPQRYEIVCSCQKLKDIKDRLRYYIHFGVLVLFLQKIIRSISLSLSVQIDPFLFHSTHLAQACRSYVCKCMYLKLFKLFQWRQKQKGDITMPWKTRTHTTHTCSTHSIALAIMLNWLCLIGGCDAIDVLWLFLCLLLSVRLDLSEWMTDWLSDSLPPSLQFPID